MNGKKRDEAAAHANRLADHLQEASNAAIDLLITLSKDVKSPVKTDVKAAHRRAHRMGVPAKLATDPEVQAFVESRLDTHTFGEIAKAIADNFPPERHVSRSSIHRWWQKLGRM